MNETDDLDPLQYQKLYWEDDVPLRDVRKSTLRKFVYLGCVLCCLFIFAGLFIKFPDQVELPFVIRSDASEEIYRYANAVYLVDKYVKPQDSVKKGQPLMKITSAEIAGLVKDYHQAEQNLQNFYQQRVLSVSKQKKMMTNKMGQTVNNIHETQNELSLLDSTWKSNIARAQFENEDAIKKYEGYKKLFDEGVIAKFELADHEVIKIRASDSLNIVRQNYAKEKFNLSTLSNQYLLENNSMDEEIRKLGIDSRYDSVSLVNQFTLAKNKIKNIYGDFELADGHLILKANDDGIVSYVFDGDKEVAAGSILMKIITRTTSLYALAKTPPSLIGKIRKNKQVVLKVASFPFYEWGTIKGNVENLSLAPDESGNFSVKISLENSGNLHSLLLIGMNGDAAVILEEKTFFYYFFRKTKEKYYKATMGY